MKKAIAQRPVAAVGTVISYYINGFHIPFGLVLMVTVRFGKALFAENQSRLIVYQTDFDCFWLEVVRFARLKCRKLSSIMWCHYMLGC